MMGDLMLWGFYGRVSSAEQTLNNSIPSQRDACYERARERGATQMLDFVDAGVPGDLDWTDRPALSHMLEMVEKGLLVGIVVYDPDRLARNLGVQLAVTEIITKHSVKLEFVTQEFNASPEGMLFYQIRGAVSQFERAKIRERTNRGRKRLLRSGKPANRVWTYGLIYDRMTDTWSLNETKAEVIRRIFAWAAQGRGSRWIADRLNEDGVAPPGAPNSHRWWSSTIMRMLQNKAYIGKFYVHRYNYEGHRKNRFLPKERRFRVQERPESDWIEIAVPPILSEIAWRAAQAAIGDNRQKWGGAKSKYYEYLASHLARCGLCGSKMQGATGTRRTQPTCYYRCWGKYGPFKNGCPMPHLKAADLDAELWREIRSLLTEPERYRMVAASVIASKPPAVLVAPEGMRAQVEEVRTDINRLHELIQRGIVKEVEVRSALRSQREREARLLAQLRSTEPSAAALEELPAGLMDQLTPLERKQHIRRVLSEIVIYPDGRLELVPRVVQRAPFV
jgi:site-specific DNA recombinase